MVPVSLDDVDYVRELLYAVAGIAIEREKEYLIQSRLLPVVRKTGSASIGDLLSHSRRESSGGVLRKQIVEALTTNETSFFRDLHPFESLRTQVLPALMAARRRERRLNIWCAACSTGQEPYSLAMLLREHFPELQNSWQARILATDLNEEVIKQAASGRYTQMQVNRGLPVKLLVRYFHREPDGSWQLSPDIMKMVEFFPLNLIGSMWDRIPALDLVFLRNVMIYFDHATKKRTLARVKDLLRPDGYLLLGSAETALRIYDGFALHRIGNATFFRPGEQMMPPPSPFGMGAGAGLSQ